MLGIEAGLGVAGMEGARRATGILATGAPSSPLTVPESEVLEKPERRRFTAEYKARVMEEVSRCKPMSGELGALLRREGLHHSTLVRWRQERERGVLHGLTPKKRGRKGEPTNPLAHRMAELLKENERLQRRLKQAETIIEVQKKVSEILGIPLPSEKLEEID